MTLRSRARPVPKVVSKSKVIQLQQIVTASGSAMRQIVEHTLLVAPELAIEPQTESTVRDAAPLEGEHFASEWETGEAQTSADPSFERHDAGLAMLTYFEEIIGQNHNVEGLSDAVEARLESGAAPLNVPVEVAVALAEAARAQRASRAQVSVAYEVRVAGDRVIVNLAPTVADHVFLRRGHPLTQIGLGFFEKRALRARILEELGNVVLGDIQAPFFHEGRLASALLQLAPVPPRRRRQIPLDLPFTLDDAYWSRLGKLFVACPQGCFPFDVFLQTPASLFRAWSTIAQNREMDSRTTRAWILDTARQRAATSSGTRSRLWKDFASWVTSLRGPSIA